MFIFAPCLVCSVGSTHTGPQRCVTLMIPYWSSLLKWHHHHYHSISRPLIGRLVTIQPSHWLIVSCGVTDTEQAARERHWRTSLLPHSLHTTEPASLISASHLNRGEKPYTANIANIESWNTQSRMNLANIRYAIKIGFVFLHLSWYWMVSPVCSSFNVEPPQPASPSEVWLGLSPVTSHIALLYYYRTTKLCPVSLFQGIVRKISEHD